MNTLVGVCCGTNAIVLNRENNRRTPAAAVAADAYLHKPMLEPRLIALSIHTGIGNVEPTSVPKESCCAEVRLWPFCEVVASTINVG